MDKKILLTIGRQYGSGGHEIGEQLAKRLNIALYDKDILLKTAESSGFGQAVLEQFDEKTTNSFWYSLAMGLHGGKGGKSEYHLPLPEQVFLAQFETIKKIASQNSGIFIGRCADYVLKDESDCIKIFIYAPLDKRVQRIRMRRSVSEKEALALIEKTDRQRATYYGYYSMQQWGEKRSNYHLCIDSNLCGIDETSEILYNIVRSKLG